MMIKRKERTSQEQKEQVKEEDECASRLLTSCDSRGSEVSVREEVKRHQQINRQRKEFFLKRIHQTRI